MRYGGAGRCATGPSWHLGRCGCGPALRCALVCAHKTFTKGRSLSVARLNRTCLSIIVSRTTAFTGEVSALLLHDRLSGGRAGSVCVCVCHRGSLWRGWRGGCDGSGGRRLVRRWRRSRSPGRLCCEVPGCWSASYPHTANKKSLVVSRLLVCTEHQSKAQRLSSPPAQDCAPVHAAL